MKTKKSWIYGGGLLPVASFCAVLAVLLFPAITLGAAELTALHGHVPDAVAAGLQPSGRLPASNRLYLSIALPFRNQGELTNLVRQIYSSSSTNFHHYLTTEEFTERFGPTVQDYQAVQDFARSNRLEIVNTFGNRALLDVSGRVADIEAALHVTLRTYRHPTENREFYAPDVEPKVDSNLSIMEIKGLDNYVLPRPGGLGISPPHQHPGGGSAGNGDFIGYDFRNAYAPGVSLTGTGQTVGLFELDAYYPADITAYENLGGLPHLVPTPVVISPFNGVPSGNFNSVGEVSLDIESEIAMAPGMNQLLVYEGNNSGSILTRIATDNIAKQISSSWFFGRSSSYDQTLIQLAAQGQTFFQCSGDNLAYVGGINYGANSGPPADDPYLVSVGGTILTTASNKTWQSEIVWNNLNGVNGSGGGVSTVYGIPAWQQSVNMSANGGSSSFRNIPDVCMVADHCTFVSNNGSTNSWWGTSIAAPLWAGFTALINEQATSEGRPTVGFLDPAIYNIGQSVLYGTSFHDITSGSNIWSSSPSSYYATTGYDLCTGWGSPTGINIINALAGLSGPVFVDFNYTGSLSTYPGTILYPWKTLAEGTNAVSTYGTIIIITGGSSSETMTIKKPMTITASDGAATIGN